MKKKKAPFLMISFLIVLMGSLVVYQVVTYQMAKKQSQDANSLVDPSVTEANEAKKSQTLQEDVKSKMVGAKTVSAPKPAPVAEEAPMILKPTEAAPSTAPPVKPNMNTAPHGGQQWYRSGAN
jgi:outer membrane biosynthesis protein TonB